MCGFAGEFVFTPGRANRDGAAAMAARLVHRGPDEEGAFLSEDGRCAIGFRRLAVIDPAGSQQPMTSADGKATVAFNGEIYNFRQLREQLVADGARFRTAGDTEVLLHLYAAHGAEMVERLDGMFAFALYDAAAGRLLLARDRLGQKPLWYSQTAEGVVFASEAKALLARPGSEGRMEKDSVSTYLAIGYSGLETSLFASFRKLTPGCVVEISGAGASPRTYWSPEPCAAVGVGDVVDAVRQRVREAVEARMVSDVPIGALLSGGVDSAIVVALMAQAAGGSGGVKTFSAGFESSEYDERPAAAEVARHCGTDHTELLVQPSPAGMVDRIVDMYDEPFGDSSAIPTWLICQEARKHVTVALGGDGGDEVFGGYDRYRAMHLAETAGTLQYIVYRAAAALARPFAGQAERGRLRRLIRFADALPHPPAVRYFMYRRLFGPADLVRLLHPDFAATVDVEAPARWFCELYEDADLPDEVARAQRHDLMTYLPDDLLVKTDIASMASSLELRAPMLDHRVVELGLSLPTERKLNRRRGKLILREAFGDLLPAGVFTRPKRGFAVPLARWLREDLKDEMCDTLLDSALADRGIFQTEALAGLIADHLGGRADHSHRLWALLVLARWLAKYA